MEAKSIGKFIATLRKANGYTQAQLAEMLGVSNKTISNWENEVSYPDLSLIPVIADLFNVTSDELLRGAKDNQNVQIENKPIEQYNETKASKIKENLKKNLMNKYSNQIFISLGILGVSYILFFFGIILLKDNNGIYIENEKIWGTIVLIFGLLVYGTGLIFSIINSNNFLNKLDAEDDNSALYYFHLRKNLLLKCLYGFIILSPFFIYFHDKKLLSDDKYNASKDVKSKIKYNNKLKTKIVSIFGSLILIIGIGIIVLNLLPIQNFEVKRYDDTVLVNEGKFEVNIYNDSFSIKSLSEIHSITVHKFDYDKQFSLESKVYQIKTLFKNLEELEDFAEFNNYSYYLDGFKIEITEDLHRMFIRYDSDIIIVLYYNEYKDYIIFSDEELTLIDVGNNKFKSVTSHTHYVRDICFFSSYIVLLCNAVIGVTTYFTKKKYIKNKQ